MHKPATKKLQTLHLALHKVSADYGVKLDPNGPSEPWGGTDFGERRFNSAHNSVVSIIVHNPHAPPMSREYIERNLDRARTVLKSFEAQARSERTPKRVLGWLASHIKSLRQNLERAEKVHGPKRPPVRNEKGLTYDDWLAMASIRNPNHPGNREAWVNGEDPAQY